MSKIITSLNNPHIKALTALHMRKNRRETGLFLTEGRRHVEEALKHGWHLQSLLHTPDAENIAPLAAKAEHVLEVTAPIMERVARKPNPQNIMAAFIKRTQKLAGIAPQNCWIALENIRDPGNLGTIIRTADGAGATGVILVGECCDAFSLETMRASMGSLFALPLVEADPDEFYAFAQNWQGGVIGTGLASNAQDYRKVTYQKPALLIMGNEQAGLSAQMQSTLTHLVKIPMRQGVDSLNLAIASGIMLYKILHA